MQENLVFNRVHGLRFLYDNFPYLYDSNRINLYFVSSKTQINSLNINKNSYDTILLKRSSNKEFISDIKFKDNRFFSNFEELIKGIEEFDDIFDFCVECHKFKTGENYYSDRLAIAQFSTRKNTDSYDRVNFIPAKMPGINTRDNLSYLEIEFNYNYGNFYKIKKTNYELLKINKFDDYSISLLAVNIHNIIDNVRERLVELSCYDDFQMIIRIDKYLNLLPIDFRTAKSWININK